MTIAALAPAAAPQRQPAVGTDSEQGDMAMMGLVASAMVATFVFKGRQG